MSAVEAVFMDIDGVAVVDNRIIPSAIETIGELHDAGIVVAPATSRNFHRSKWLRSALGFKSLGVFNGGALIADCKEDAVIHGQPIGRDTARQLIERLLPLSQYVNFGAGRTAAIEADPGGIDADCLSLWAEVPIDRLGAAAQIVQSVPGVQHHPSYDMVDGHMAGINITRQGVDKFSGTRYALRWLGIAPENAVAIADGESDGPLFDAVGFGIAMGNATEELKARADAVVGAALDNGFREGMRQFVLHNITER